MTLSFIPRRAPRRTERRSHVERGALRAFRSSCTRGGRGSTYSLTALWICAQGMTSVNLSLDVRWGKCRRGPHGQRVKGGQKSRHFAGFSWSAFSGRSEGGAAGRPSIPHATMRCDTARFLPRPSWNPARARTDDAPDSWNCRNVKSADQGKAGIDPVGRHIAAAP